MKEALKAYPITHAGIRPVRHPDLGVVVNGQTAVQYLRFMRRVKVDSLELPQSAPGRWIPGVLAHPAHIVVSTLNRRRLRWEVVREFNLPYNPRIAGEGLTQAMTMQQMQDHFSALLKDPPHVLKLGGVETECLRVECDREHPIWPNHGECNGGIFNVPFAIFLPLKAFGKPAGGLIETPYHPPLSVKRFAPRAPAGMKVRDLPHMLLFEGRRLSVGFSLRRPLIMHLGWDALGAGQASASRILASLSSPLFNQRALGGLSGPTVRTLTQENPCTLWTGAVSVEGNRIRYSNLSAVPGLTVDAQFTVEPERIELELVQRCKAELPVIESEAWRFCWNELAGITGAAAVPTERPGRNGEVELPMMWASDGVGCLSCRLTEGDPARARMQIESFRVSKAVTGGLVLAPRPEPDAPLVIPKGSSRAVLELAVSNFEPQAAKGAQKSPEAIRRHWASSFACFRPEFRGFSNNAVSTNCHVSQLPTTLIAVLTKKPRHGPDPVRLAQFTIGKALLDGGGYGYFRNLYLDSDPTLVNCAALIHGARPGDGWLRRVEPGLRAAMKRIFSTLGEEGLAICRDLSGNSGTFRWSTNLMDVIGFGHMDAYVNALTYSALSSAPALFDALGDRVEGARCLAAAQRLRQAYAKHLLNPKTGWIAGWRSRDGQLHDAAFTWVNGPALCAGLLNDKQARTALRNLERARREAGAGSARIGLPFNLRPIAKADHMLSIMRGEALPTFESYTDGSLCGLAAMFYLRALQKYGFRTEAAVLAAETEESFACGMQNGGMNSGVEFRTWEGLPCGYEGSLMGCFGAMYPIAVQRGIVRPDALPAGF